MDKGFDRHSRVERAKERGRDRQARDDDRVAAVHHAGEPCAGGDHAFRRDVMPTAWQAGAKVFVQRSPDEALEVEAWKGEGAHAPP